MTQQGAALQNYNNELVKCERPRDGARREGWEGAGLSDLRAQEVAGAQRAAALVARFVCGCPGRFDLPSAQPRCGTHQGPGVCGVSGRTNGLGMLRLPGPAPGRHVWSPFKPGRRGCGTLAWLGWRWPGRHPRLPPPVFLAKQWVPEWEGWWSRPGPQRLPVRPP